eukprot:COSAG01_NODE_253_length_20220_cov_22.308196_18_plen_74_part_00
MSQMKIVRAAYPACAMPDVQLSCSPCTRPAMLGWGQRLRYRHPTTRSKLRPLYAEWMQVEATEDSKLTQLLYS